MLNSTSSYYQQKQIDFTVMGLEATKSDFLNWCMQNIDNLEFIRQCKTLEKASQASVLHADHLKMIKKIDDVITHQRA